jgi:hypothetical protein
VAHRGTGVDAHKLCATAVNRGETEEAVLVALDVEESPSNHARRVDRKEVGLSSTWVIDLGQTEGASTSDESVESALSIVERTHKLAGIGQVGDGSCVLRARKIDDPVPILSLRNAYDSQRETHHVRKAAQQHGCTITHGTAVSASVSVRKCTISQKSYWNGG